MLGYDFEIIYKKGKQNVVADALSRKDEDVEALLCAISIIQPDWINEASEEWKNDEEVWTLIQKLQQDSSDWVFLRLQPYKQMSLKQAKKDNKLSPKYYGLYNVLQKVGTMAYKLELPTASQVHPVFHVSCLKKVIYDKLPVQTILPEIDEEGKIILEPEAVIETRTRQLRNRSISEYLMKWKNLSVEDTTWEDENFIQKHPKLLKC
eukprot:PITA_11542